MGSDQTLRTTPLDRRHRAAGAKMAAFGGWDMPLDYGSVVAEHTAVRERAGAFDLSHLGTVRVEGPAAQAVVQRAFSNDAAALDGDRAHYTLCLNDAAGIIDDLIVYRVAWGFFVVPNAANAPKVIARLDACAADAEVTGGREVQVRDVKDDLACIALQGPEALGIAAQLGAPVEGTAYMDCTAALGGVVARTGYTGEQGVELFVPAGDAEAVWDAAVVAGATPAGLGSRDTLRLEMGYPLHGSDISSATSPVAARLGWAVKVGTGFVGEEAYVAAKADGPRERLVGLSLTARGVPRAHCEVLLDGSSVGETTSGTHSPTLGHGIAMAYVDAEVAWGTTVEVAVRAKRLAAEVVRPPFVDADPKG